MIRIMLVLMKSYNVFFNAMLHNVSHNTAMTIKDVEMIVVLEFFLQNNYEAG